MKLQTKGKDNKGMPGSDNDKPVGTGTESNMQIQSEAAAERRAALELLDLHEDADDDDIRSRYDVLLKKYKYFVAKGMPQEEADRAMKEIDSASRLLLGFDDGQDHLQNEDGNQGQRRGKGAAEILSRAWFENFLYHYKYRALAIISITVLAIVLVVNFFNRPVYDMSISFVGEIYALNTDVIKQKITENSDMISNPRIDMNSLPNPVENSFQSSIRERLTVNMAVGAIDVCITDLAYLEEYCALGVFMPLEDALARLGFGNEGDLASDPEGLELFRLKGKNGEEERIYGISVADSGILSDSGFIGDIMVFTIMHNTDNYENCLEMLEILLREEAARQETEG